MTIDLIHADLLASVAELRDVASALETERRLADRAVGALLDGGWSGRAASAYLEGWEEWRAGCGQVLAALSAMAELIAVAHTDQVEQDGHAAVRLDAMARALAGDLARDLVVGP